MTDLSLFDRVEELPDSDAQVRFDRLLGLDGAKQILLAWMQVLLDPTLVDRWSMNHYSTVLPLTVEVATRSPLIIFQGDVGNGKTELAETIGDPLARTMGIPVRLMSLTLTARGQGAVGQMTTLLTEAFRTLVEMTRGARNGEGKGGSATILLIDEADSFAQSRELDQMHHEDRAGVNALIRGIDLLRKERVPVIVIMSTNRPGAIDPGVKRRSSLIVTFDRPSIPQVRSMLNTALEGCRLPESAIDEIADALGNEAGRGYGASYSDIRTRFLPDLVVRAVQANEPIDALHLKELAQAFIPTKPFGEAVD